MQVAPAEYLLELRDEFALGVTAEERQWEYVHASSTSVVIMPCELPQVLFRGQGTRYSPSLTSLGRGLRSEPVASIAHLNLAGQAKLADRIVRRIWFSRELAKHPAATWLEQHKVERFDHALAQHYGVPTGYMDLSESFDVSCFFATCYVDKKGRWQPRSNGNGVMYMLPIAGIPIRPEVLQPIGLQVLPRPREQFGWLVVCGMGSDFEDIPGLQLLEFAHRESIGQWFLEKFSHGAALFPPDAMAEVADRIMRSSAVPMETTVSVVRDLCSQESGFTGRQEDIIAALSGELGLALVDDVEVYDDRLKAQSRSEWATRSENFLKRVGFRLVRHRR